MRLHRRSRISGKAQSFCSTWAILPLSNRILEGKGFFPIRAFPWFDPAGGFPSSRPQSATAGARRSGQDRPSLRPRHERDAARPHLDATEHDGMLVLSGAARCLPPHHLRGSARSAEYTVLFAVEGVAASWPFEGDRRRNDPNAFTCVAGRIARSPRPVPAGTTVHCEGQ